MKYVDSGSGKVPLISLIAILSISLIVNLPGLAVSPLLGQLKEVFPHVTELESQLLIVLPNFIIIPFILWSGKICNQKNQITVLAIGLLIYIVSGILFLFANSMTMLIVLSCLLGIGCGLCIPLAASLISQNFFGQARTRQLGMKSGISNFTVIFATLFVGWIASIGWHWAFAVYLVPIVPLCLLPFMTNSYLKKNKISAPVPAPAETTAAAKPAVQKSTFSPKQTIILLLGVIGVYVAMTYGTMVVSDFLPYTMKHYALNTTEVGVVTADFFLFATLAGFTLTKVIKLCGRATPYLAIGACVVGLYACGIFHHFVVYLVAIALVGFGYGIMQPIIYDKTAFLAPNDEKSTEYFAYTLTGNYIAIALVPFIVDLFAKIFSCSTLNFPYIFNASILLAVLCIGFFKCKSYVFNMKAA